MVELHDVTIVLKDPSVDKVRAALRNLRQMGVLFPTQLSSQSIHGMAPPRVVSQLEQARDVLVLSRRLEITEAEVVRTIDPATALREMEEKEAALQAEPVPEPKPEPEPKVEVEAAAPDPPKKKKVKKKAAKKKPVEEKPVEESAPKKVKPQRKAKSQRKAKNKRKVAKRSKRQNRKNR